MQKGDYWYEKSLNNNYFMDLFEGSDSDIQTNKWAAEKNCYLLIKRRS